MKTWLLMALLISSCSSKKKEKEFLKSLDKPDEPNAAVEVEAPKILLDKFEVDKAEVSPPAVETKKTPPKKTVPVVSSKPVVKNAAAVVVPSKLPKDYPPEMLKLNEKGEKVWNLYKPNHKVGEKIFLDIHYLGMTVGKVMVTNRGKKTIKGKEVWHFHSRFKSAPFYSSIYELDDTVDTYVDTDKFLSVRYSLIQRESKQDIDDLQLHDRDQMKTFWFYKQKKSNGEVKNKQKEAFIPNFSIDPFSVLYFFQGLPMKDGDKYEIPIINKAKMLLLKAEIEGREEIKTELHAKVKSIRVHATTQYTGETLKSGDIYLWFSDDEQRALLKAQAKIKIGSVTVDIVDEK